MFLTEDEKTRHFKSMHTTKLVCSDKKCNSAFSERSSLERHERKQNMPMKKFKKCSKCKKTFRFRSELTTHMKAHSNKTYFTCKMCNKEFKHAGELNRHAKSCGKDKDFLSVLIQTVNIVQET